MEKSNIADRWVKPVATTARGGHLRRAEVAGMVEEDA